MNELTSENLDLALDVFFGDGKKILKTAFESKSSKPLQTLLLRFVFFTELKRPSSLTPVSIILKLIQMVKKDELGTKTALASLNFLLSEAPSLVEPESDEF